MTMFSQVYVHWHRVHSKISSDELTPQFSGKWRRSIRLLSPSATSDSDSDPKSPTGSDPALRGFMSLPVDVFASLASYFHPQDVLALSRVNSFLRQLLMSCKAEFIWRCARKNVIGLPPCPCELSEPTYAALLFSKICTLCGRRALQSMDPILLERLCRRCKDSRLVDVSQHEIDASLVFTSTTVLPGYSEYWPERGPWCFYDDVQAVKIKLDEFNVIGDEEAKQSWIKKRQSIIRAREQRCEPLKKWLQRLEMEREAELGRRRLARQEEIETRLKELGHDERDIDFQDSNESFILVHNTKPLTNKAWGKLLPKLLKVIKANRRERIKSEREDRSMRIADWAWDICGPKVFSLCEQHDNEGRSLNATKILIDKLESQPKVKLLLDKERSDNEFERDFESQKSELGDFLTNWVNEQEARLVSMMPSDTPTADFDSLGSYPTMAFKTHVDLTRVPMTALPINTQRLLRADAIFTRGGKLGHPSTGSNICYFYPDFDTLPEAFTYSSTASEIASNLLTCLGRPNASYLEMTSGGYALHCGICPETRSLGWKDMIEHCLNEHWDPEPEGIPNI